MSLIPNVVNNSGDQVTWSFPVTNGPVVNLLAYVDITIPTELQVLGSSYDSGTLTLISSGPSVYKWDIPLAVNEKRTISFSLKFVTASTIDADFLCFANVNGLDDAQDDNDQEDILSFVYEVDCPSGNAVDDMTCLCSDVAANDTPCTEGTSKWVYNAGDLVNGVMVHWDEAKGIGFFSYIDTTLPITYTYNLVCTIDGVDLAIRTNVAVTIPASLADKDIYDHTIRNVLGINLTVAEDDLLSAANPTLDVSDFDWIGIYNADGDMTSAILENTAVADSILAVVAGGLTVGQIAELAVLYPGVDFSASGVLLVMNPAGDITSGVIIDSSTSYRLATETFGPLVSGNSVTLVGTIIVGSASVVLRNGMGETDHVQTGNVFVFGVAFAIPSGGVTGEMVDITYLTIV